MGSISKEMRHLLFDDVPAGFFARRLKHASTIEDHNYYMGKLMDAKTGQSFNTQMHKIDQELENIRKDVINAFWRHAEVSTSREGD